MAGRFYEPRSPIQSYAPEIASFGNMIDAFYENRMKRQQFEREQAERERAAQAEEQYKRDYLGLQGQEAAARANDMATRRKFEENKYSQEQAAQGHKAISEAMQVGGSSAAAAAAQARGWGFDPVQDTGRFEVTMPAGGSFFLQSDVEGAEKQRRARAASEQLDSITGGQYRQQAVAESKQAADAGLLAPDKMAEAVARRQHELEQAALSERNSIRAAAAAAAAREEKPPTEAQARYAMLGAQMQRELEGVESLPPLSDDALSRMQDNEMQIDAAARAGQGVVGSLLVPMVRSTGAVARGKYEGLSADEQSALNQWDAAVENFVRLKTGAGMPDSEARKAAMAYMPQAGESPAVQRQKYRRLLQASQDMMALAGRAAGIVDTAGAGKPGATRPGARPGPSQAPGRRQVVRTRPSAPSSPASLDLDELLGAKTP